LLLHGSLGLIRCLLVVNFLNVDHGHERAQFGNHNVHRLLSFLLVHKYIFQAGIVNHFLNVI
jgi:hypothetical protein